MTDLSAALGIDTRFSDLSLISDSKEFKLHKAIMCRASPVIAAICVSKMREADSGSIEHSEFDVETVKRMILFVYEQEYTVTEASPSQPDASDAVDMPEDDEAEGSAADQAIEDADFPALEQLKLAGRQPVGLSDYSGLIEHTRAYRIAEYYHIQPLKQKATDNLISLFANLCYMLDPADFTEVIEEVCQCSPKGDVLRTKRLSLLSNLPDLATDAAFTAALGERRGGGVQSFLAKLMHQVGAHVHNNAAENAQKISSLEAKIEHLNQTLKNLHAAKNQAAAEAASELSWVKEREEHMESVMARLVDMLEGLDEDCPSSGCQVKFGKIVLERKDTIGLWVRIGWRGVGVDGVGLVRIDVPAVEVSRRDSRGGRFRGSCLHGGRTRLFGE